MEIIDSEGPLKINSMNNLQLNSNRSMFGANVLPESPSNNYMNEEIQ